MGEREKVDLLCIVLCQSRPATLDAALHQVLNECPEKTGLKTAVVLSPDRPTQAVQDMCYKWECHRNVLLDPLPFPLVSPEEGQQWMKGRNWMLDVADQFFEPRWLMCFDDDWQLGPGWDRHLPAMLNHDHIVSWRAVSLVLWGRADGNGVDVNIRQHHCAPILGRHRPGWRFDMQLTDMTTKQCKELVQADASREAFMPFFLMDLGTVNAAERRVMFKKYFRAGKTCQYVRNYVEPPIRKSVEWVLDKLPAPEAFYRWQLDTLRKKGVINA